MKKTLLPAAVLAFAAFFASCDKGGMCLRGEGDLETRTLDLTRLEGVSVNGGTRVFITKGDRQRVEVKGQPNVLDELETEVHDGGGR